MGFGRRMNLEQARSLGLLAAAQLLLGRASEPIELVLQLRRIVAMGAEADIITRPEVAAPSASVPSVNTPSRTRQVLTGRSAA